jgi:hypothetical protein
MGLVDHLLNQFERGRIIASRFTDCDMVLIGRAFFGIVSGKHLDANNVFTAAE